MERAEAYGFSAAMSGAFLLSCLLFAAVNRQQRGPYMDEAFHVPQAQAYCHGRFLQIHQKNQAVSGFQRILSTLTLAMFPTLYFFTFLYYTDPGSVFFTLFAYLMCLYGEKVFICLARYKSSCAYIVHSCAVLSSMSIDTGSKVPLSTCDDAKDRWSITEMGNIFIILQPKEEQKIQASNHTKPARLQELCSSD
ncbi:putative Dol-P-Glc:Glc(2)Man(9)GlcNAc(2)-PP-Dol alpha-1,2-glucosyltransferase [Patagioenas fasciata monilis]|uniref:Dol-P-Glc:Glc(2)Man(9)GlcNAc(2)-PP-Dol alpha-1,2-glucosyltransferase n=1 Tax=Patagioenas fasciata monilis TaxID=372326 RepID=A0A1V4K029_PATFA|nr:putative Dol-P-Glc:Glc(2)Man(9)GlcNAc(2)-PP-Dol alpha-1,2-glucosyltransferase [Patagioenas fasciata monilis]